MLNIELLEKSYGEFQFLVQKLLINEGEVVGLVGNNGAGKTTFLKLITDLVLSKKGSVSIFGFNVGINEEWKKDTSVYLDEDFLIPYLKPIEYLLLLKTLKNLNQESFDSFLREIEDFCGDLIKSNKYLSELSKGISGALLGNSRLLILDEPFSNLDPSSSIFLSNYLVQKRKSKGNLITIISSHNINQLTIFSSRIILFDDGKIVLDKTNLSNIEQDLNLFFSKKQ